MAESATLPYPFIIFQGDLDSSVNKVHVAAEKTILCSSEKSLVEGTLALVAAFYVFMFEHPPGLVNFILYLQKCILQIQDGIKAAIYCHTI